MDLAPSPSGQFIVKFAHEIIVQITSLKSAPLTSTDWESFGALKLQQKTIFFFYKKNQIDVIHAPQ